MNACNARAGFYQKKHLFYIRIYRCFLHETLGYLFE